jgi:hypothetical protein
MCRAALLSLFSKLEEKYSKRNFALGTVYLSVECKGQIDGLPSAKDACARYFNAYRRKSACFRDIQTYIANLPEKEYSLFLEDIDQPLGEEEVIS